MSDADLILRFRAGQHQAFNVLVWRWQGRLYRFALRYSGDVRRRARPLPAEFYPRL